MKCKICEIKFNEFLDLSNHIRYFHKMKIRFYYDQYLKKDGEGICYCGNNTRFSGIKGYSEYCSSKCFSEKIWKNKKHLDSTKLKMSKNRIGLKLSSETKQKMSLVAIGKKHGSMKQETKDKLSEINSKYRHTIEAKLKISEKLKGKKFSNDHKHNLSVSVIQYLKNNNWSPRRGKNENFIIDQLEQAINEKILRNDLNIASITGKSNDGYISKYNLPIEILEKYHFTPYGILCDYDKQREVLIASKLGCMIYYIIEKDFLDFPEKEITRFKNFISLITEQNQKVV